MIPLRPTTIALVAQLEEKSGRGVEFMRQDDLAVLASLQIARQGAPFHVLRYKPSNAPLDYFVMSQVEFVLRMFELPPEERFDFVSTGKSSRAMTEIIQASTDLPPADKQILPIFAEHLGQWALMQLRSIPIGMRVEAWLRDSHPDMRELQARGLSVQQQMNADILGKRLGNLTVPIVHLGPPAAFALFADRLLGASGFAIPFRAAGAIDDGQRLLDLFDSVPSAPTHDRDLVDQWGYALGMEGWYKWVPYQP
jgi:hypothetical protein